MVGRPAKFPIVLCTHCCPGRQAGGDAMRDRRHNEEWRPQICSSSIVRLAQGWEGMEDRGEKVEGGWNLRMREVDS